MKTKNANIYIENFRHNISEIRSLYSSSVKICIPVKAQAYGHGAVFMAREAVKNGTDFLAVASVDEAVELRNAGIICPILLFGIADNDEIDTIAANSITCFVHSEKYAALLECSAKKYNTIVAVHIKVDTGMGRIGCKPEEAASLAVFIDSCKHLQLGGISTHLSVSDSLEEDDIAYTRMQIETFSYAVETIKERSINPGIVHCANSGAVFLHEEACFDMIRPGISVYGYYPNPEIEPRIRLTKPVFKGLKPVMEVTSTIVQIKTINSPQSVSYGRTWKAAQTTKIATIPMGYADGLFRSFSPGISVNIHGKEYPVVGRICMDQCMVDLGNDISFEEGDSVVFFGPRKGCLTADDYAKIAHTISYEILCGIGQRVLRNYIF